MICYLTLRTSSINAMSLLIITYKYGLKTEYFITTVNSENEKNTLPVKQDTFYVVNPIILILDRYKYKSYQDPTKCTFQLIA